MELFLEFLLTVAFSLLFSFFLAKILSVSSPSSSSSSNCECDLVSGLKPYEVEKVVTCELELQADFGNNGFEGDKRSGSVEEVMEVDDLSEPGQENTLLDGTDGSFDDVKIVKCEFLREVEVENAIEEVFEKEHLVVGSLESKNIVHFEKDLTKGEVDVAKSEEIEVSESECDNEIDEGNRNEKDGCMSGIIECEEILVDKSNETEKIAKIEPEVSKTEVVMARSEEMEILEGKCDNEIDEANKNDEDGNEILVDRSNDSENIAKIEAEISKTEVGVARREEREILECQCDDEIGEGNKNEEDGAKEALFDEDDDWEGIERTELERLFGAAVAFVGSRSNADRISSLGSDVKMQLYGLHKIATVGPCNDPQPMALKVSARANWNAWKQLGNMTPEVAMEQYVIILSGSIPGCIQGDIGGEVKWISADSEAFSKLATDLKTWQAGQLGDVDKRNVDDELPHNLEGF